MSSKGSFCKWYYLHAFIEFSKYIYLICTLEWIIKFSYIITNFSFAFENKNHMLHYDGPYYIHIFLQKNQTRNCLLDGNLEIEKSYLDALLHFHFFYHNINFRIRYHSQSCLLLQFFHTDLWLFYLDCYSWRVI